MGKKRKKKVKKELFFHNKKWIVFVVFLILLSAISVRNQQFIETEYHDNFEEALEREEIEEEQVDESAKVFLPTVGDFQNTEQGTFFIDLKIDLPKLIEQAHRIPKYIVFFESSTIPRLTLRYNLHDSVIEGGLPLIKSGPLQFLDNEFHKITYTFHEDQGQAIFFDGKKILETPFDTAENLITGNVVYDGLYSLGSFDYAGGSNYVGLYIGDSDILR